MARPVIVLGLGNLLLTDDGAGVVALHRLARAVRPDPGIRFVDGGTLGLALLDFIEPESVLILVDAVAAPGPPGTIVVLEGSDVAAAASAQLSSHQVGVADLLCAADQLGRTPWRTVLVGVVPASLELGVERTPAVEAALPALVAAVIGEAARAGVLLQPLEEGHARGAVVDVSDALGL